jgi:hypothetical protein
MYSVLTALQHQRALLLVEWEFLQVHETEQRDFHPEKYDELINPANLGPKAMGERPFN